MKQRIELLNAIRMGYNTRKGAQFKIWIENLTFNAINDKLYLVIYEEWLEIKRKVKRRLSTALFQWKDSLPNKVEWSHVHETWLPTENE
ncbi:MAG: hypothetical protein ACFE9L_07360 [Candidatus Hodarchaeota archaeon]